jgi:hypothetical protein
MKEYFILQALLQVIFHFAILLVWVLIRIMP